MGGSQSSPEAMEAAKAVVSGAIAANPVVIFSKTYCERSHRPSAPLIWPASLCQLSCPCGPSPGASPQLGWLPGCPRRAARCSDLWLFVRVDAAERR